ncbi:GPI mannosyltransferase 1 [Taxawa tesnikishii (nom. ined.)]|nr:GPI mannosyltransferase 1 [Dothideales sp. JES 119]
MPSLFHSAPLVFALAVLLRLILLFWGRYQDTHSPLKYTDIDYLVFTDASRFVSRSRSPYARDTYRYTPLLAWLLYPTAFGGFWFEFGKVLFALGDVVTGWLAYSILTSGKAEMSKERALKYASIWLLNPMVANISTRGSSEGLLAVIVVALLWAVMSKYIRLAGVLLGLAVHFKIYPFIYAASIFWWLDETNVGTCDLQSMALENPTILNRYLAFFNRKRLQLAIFSLVTFMGLNLIMLRMYGMEFVEHSYAYHLIRIDHRHNFSIYNTLLHLKSAAADSSGFGVESVAFVPQLFLSVVAIPFLLAKKDIAGTMLAQTFAFVTFNKVCTSQYFLWYMVFLPFYLPSSSFIKHPKLGLSALALWVLGQAAWLQQGYQLEFLGNSTFVPGLWLASMLFFAINTWILDIIISDIGSQSTRAKDPVVQEKKVL